MVEVATSGEADTNHQRSGVAQVRGPAGPARVGREPGAPELEGSPPSGGDHPGPGLAACVGGRRPPRPGVTPRRCVPRAAVFPRPRVPQAACSPDRCVPRADFFRRPVPSPADAFPAPMFSPGRCVPRAHIFRRPRLARAGVLRVLVLCTRTSFPRGPAPSFARSRSRGRCCRVPRGLRCLLSGFVSEPGLRSPPLPFRGPRDRARQRIRGTVRCCSRDRPATGKPLSTRRPVERPPVSWPR